MSIKKIINDPNSVAADLLDGLVDYYNGSIKLISPGAIVKNYIPDDKVGLLVGGGSGHEPSYHGYVGKNLADGASCGDIFAAPPPNITLEVARAINKGKGVLFLYGNYAGDVLNFDLASNLAKSEGIEVETVLVWDDVASAPPYEKHKRRGIAGLLPIVKLAGAASNIVTSLDELKSIVVKARDNTRSVGAALKPGSIPATGLPTFELNENEIGLGMGIHGEAGVSIEQMMSSDELTVLMLDLIFKDDLPLDSNDEIILFINSLGSTTLMECLIVLKKVKEILSKMGIKLYDIIVGPKVTCQEMAGVSISITKLDTDLKKYWDMPCSSLGYTKL